MRLRGRRILITGAASGIGLAVTERFISEGARLGLIDVDERGLTDIAARLGSGVAWRKADVSDETAVDSAVNALAEELGGLDGLVNSAGVDLHTPFEETSVEDWDRLFGINLRGPFLMCRAAMPHLRASAEATIVNVASGAGLQPIRDRSGYCASKAGLVMLGKALAIEAAPEVRVNSVCPGAIDTPMLRSSYAATGSEDGAMQRIRERYLLRRVGDPREVAYAVLYLTSAESSFVTGIALAVDGGRTFH